MTAPTVKAVCDQCNGRGYMRGIGVGSPDSIYACRECSGEGWRWVRVWTDDDAQAKREWVERHLPHLVANAGAVPRRGSDVGTSPLLGLPGSGDK